MSEISYFEQVRQAIDDRLYANTDVDYSERLSNRLAGYATNILCAQGGKPADPRSYVFETVINGITNAAILGSEELV